MTMWVPQTPRGVALPCVMVALGGPTEASKIIAPITTNVLSTTHRLPPAWSRVISGCSSPPRVWTKSHTPWVPRAGTCAASGAADVRKHAKVGENWQNFQILKSRSAHECFYT